MRSLSKKLQELLEEFFRAGEGQEITFEADEDTIRKLDLILTSLAQKTEIGNKTLRVKKRRP